MARITNISRSNIEGEFTVKFSIKSGYFDIELPKEWNDKVTTRYNSLQTWPEVNEAIDKLCQEYLYKESFTRKVIVIQLKTSVSYELQRKKWGSKNEMETVVTDDNIEDASGFLLKWYVAEEFKCFDELKYKIIEGHDNSKFKDPRMEIAEQLFSSYHGEIRMLDYREDLHQFLMDIDSKIITMLEKMISYFDLDTKKFIENFEKGKFKMIT